MQKRCHISFVSHILTPTFRHDPHAFLRAIRGYVTKRLWQRNSVSKKTKHKTLGRAMAQAVSRRPLTTEARVRSQVKSMWDLWCTKWQWDRFFSELSVFPCRFHSTGAPLIVKNLVKKTAHPFIIITGVAQKALRLWCEGPSSQTKKKTKHKTLHVYFTRKLVLCKFSCP
jgi:hypothetical protein